MNIINNIKLIFISSLILISSGCSILKSEPQLTGSIGVKKPII